MPPKRKTPQVNNNPSPVKVPEKKEKKEISFVGKNYISEYKKVIDQDAPKRELFDSIIDEENYYRELFAQERENPKLNDLHLNLLNPFEGENYQLFDVKKAPQLSHSSTVFLKTEPNELEKKCKEIYGDKVIVDKNEFLRNFEVFSEGQLRFLNWDNVFVAGGAVLAALTPVPFDNYLSKRKHWHNLAYPSADIDIFLYGLESEEAANKKLIEIFNTVQETIPFKAICFRSKHAVSIVSQYPYRHIQIILRLYKSPAEILMGFDVDACSVGFNGKDVWMTPRAHKALTHRYNSIDMERRSPTYEMRLAKYGDRGFSVYVPTLDRSRVDPQLFERRFDQLQGLAKLLLLEKAKDPLMRSNYRNLQLLRRMRPQYNVQRQSALAHLTDDWGVEYESKTTSGAHDSDYSTVYLPWKEGATAEKSSKLMYSKDLILNSQWYDPEKKIHTHPCFFGTAEEVIRDCCGFCPPVPPELEDPDTPFVSGKISWITVNPGAQGKIGSFHPITEGDWTEGAYVSKETEEICAAVNVNNANKVREILANGYNPNTRDPVGRTPLMVATFCNSYESAVELLKAGAKMGLRFCDGRNVLHIASAYGYSNLLKLFLKERVKRLNEAKSKQEEEGSKKKQKGSKPKKGKKKPMKGEEDDEDAMEEDEEEEDEEMGEGENEGEDEGDEGDEGDFFSIKKLVEQKKKAEEEKLKELDPFALDNEKEDKLELDEPEWDFTMTPIQYAIFFGENECVDILLQEGAQLSPVAAATKSSFEWALSGNRLSTLELLIKRGYDLSSINTTQGNVWHLAVSARNLPFLEFLKENNIPGLNTPNSQQLVPICLLFTDYYQNNHYYQSFIPIGLASIGMKLEESEEEEEDTMNLELLSILKFLVDKAKALVNIPPQEVQQQNAMNPGLFGMAMALVVPNNNNIARPQPLARAIQMRTIKGTEYLIKKGAKPGDALVGYQTSALSLEIAIRQAENQIQQTSNDQKSLSAFEKELKSSIKGSFREWATKRVVATLNSQIEAQAIARKKQIKETELLCKLREIIAPFGSVLRIQTATAYAAQNLGANYLNAYPHAEITIPQFTYITECVGYQSINNHNITSEEARKEYERLFNYVLKNDRPGVRSLTTDRPKGKQLAITVQWARESISTLSLAIQMGLTDMVIELLKICKEQNSSIEPLIKKKDKKVLQINNYELATIKAGHHDILNSGIEDISLDLSAIQNDPNFYTSVWTFLKGSATQIVSLKEYETLVSVVNFIEKEKIEKPFYQETVKYNELPPPHIQYLMECGEDNVMATKDKRFIRFYLEKGAVHLWKMELEKQYEGLDIGGKKAELQNQYMLHSSHGNEPWAFQAIKLMEPDLAFFVIKDGPKLFEKAMKDIGREKSVDKKKADVFFSDDYSSNLTAPHSLNLNSGNNILSHAIYNSTALRLESKKKLTAEQLEEIKKSESTILACLEYDKKEHGGAFMNQPQFPALLTAISAGKERAVKLLLENGAVITSELFGPEGSRDNYLHKAVCTTNVEIVKLVLEALKKSKLDLQKGNERDGLTPLMFAAKQKQHEMVQLLLEANPYADKPKDGLSQYAIHHAVMVSGKQSVTLLLKDDKEQNQENSVGMTPLDYALQASLSHVQPAQQAYPYYGMPPQQNNQTGEDKLDILERVKKCHIDKKRTVVSLPEASKSLNPNLSI